MNHRLVISCGHLCHTSSTTFSLPVTLGRGPPGGLTDTELVIAPKYSSRASRVRPDCTMYAVAGPSRSSQPQPGDGAYLATSQPGDGRFLANGHSHGPHSNGRGRGFSRGGPRGVLRSRGRGRGGFQGGQDGMNHHSNGISTGQQYAADSNGTASTSGTHAPSGPSNINHIDPPVSISTRPPQSLGPAKRPQKPRDIVPIPSAVSQPVTQNGDGAAAPTDTDAPATKKKNKRKPKPKGDTAALVNGDAIKLDPSTPAFRPQGSGTSTTPSTRPSSPSHASANGYAGPSKARKPKNQRIKAAIPPPAAEMVPAVKSSRRAAFDQQTKLTTSADRASSTATSPSAHSAGLPEEVKEVPKKVGNRRKEEKDDLVSRLTRGLKSRPYLECPIVSDQGCLAQIVLTDSALTRSPLINPSGLASHLLRPLPHLPFPTRFQ